MADSEKRGEDENTKNWISWQRKKIFGWNKKFLNGCQLVKNGNLIKNSRNKL